MKKLYILPFVMATFLSAMDSSSVSTGDSHSDIQTTPVPFKSKAWQKPFIFIDKKTQWIDNVYELSLSDIPGVHYGYAKFPRFMRFIAGSVMVVGCGLLCKQIARSIRK